jgi:DNA-directed RNA polymerase beta' subunit
MAIHVPLSAEAQAEARVLMLSRQQHPKPSAGGRWPTTCSGATSRRGRLAKDPAEAGKLDRWTTVRWHACCSTVIIPRGLPFYNKDMKKKVLGEIAFESYRQCGLSETVAFLDRLKDFGFRNATRGGVSIGMEDMYIPGEKETLLREAEQRVERFQKAYATGNITNGERYNKVIDTWTHANTDVARTRWSRPCVSRRVASTRCS